MTASIIQKAPQVPELLLPLVGKWKGSGKGVYPTIRSFEYNEQITFEHTNQPFLIYQQRTQHKTLNKPMHSESGFWKFANDDSNEIYLAISQCTGLNELSVGKFKQLTNEKSFEIDVTCEQTNFLRVKNAKPPFVTKLQRIFTYDATKDILSYVSSYLVPIHKTKKNQLHYNIKNFLKKFFFLLRVRLRLLSSYGEKSKKKQLLNILKAATFHGPLPICKKKTTKFHYNIKKHLKQLFFATQMYGFVVILTQQFKNYFTFRKNAFSYNKKNYYYHYDLNKGKTNKKTPVDFQMFFISQVTFSRLFLFPWKHKLFADKTILRHLFCVYKRTKKKQVASHNFEIKNVLNKLLSDLPDCCNDATKIF
ncbi:DUF1794 family protein [Reticulomyxa filosa]|uniref:DUF1794 family protein n=1 Tax=Reticulomyxa filosa TaxID=46433 RepID=X6LYQ0_RETFI|nr:DUF1794 family protein [Reticulomyxa filosa]|eukprot:ETO07048.1 DUF1794 family protein [Reticulomyxa filosa]